MPEAMGGQVGYVAGKGIYMYSYDFAVQGGAVSSINLTGPSGPIPNAFVLQNAFLDILTPFTGGAGTTCALTTGQGAGDLVVAAAVTGAPWSTTGQKVTIPLLGTIATWIKMTAQRTPALVIAVNPGTAGKFNLFLEGFQSA